jgi:uncharacterized membrane protein YeaQ/YmgE (transglycosylase-associated protein family)
MFLLHVVAVSGGAGWETGVVLWLVTATLGGAFAWLAGEARRPDSLLADLALAGAGGAVANLIVRRLGTDLVAYLYGVRLLCTAAGSLVLLVAAHDVASYFGRGAAHRRRLVIITEVGGARYLYTWLSGWPFEPGGIEASYSGGLQLKLLDDALHYQVRRGPFIAAETVLIESGTVAEVHSGGLRLISRAPGSIEGTRLLEIADVRPPGGLRDLVEAIARLAEQAPTDGEG